MKNITFKKSSLGIKIVFADGIKVGEYTFNRTIGKYGPDTTGRLKDLTLNVTIDLSDFAYAKDAKEFVIEYFSN